MYSISLLSTLNAREGLRNSAEKFGHNSLHDLSTHSLSRQSVRAAIASLPLLRSHLLQADTTPRIWTCDIQNETSRKGTTSQPGPSREIVVAIQRDTTVMFEEHTAREIAYTKPSKYRIKSPTADRDRDRDRDRPTSPCPSLSLKSSAHDTKLSAESFIKAVAS